MRNRAEIYAFAGKLTQNLQESLAAVAANKTAEAELVVNGDFDTAHKAAESIKNSFDIVSKGTDADGIFVHQFLSSFKSYESDNKLESVELTIKSKLKARFPFMHKVTIAADENFVNNMCEAYKFALVQLLYIEFGGENIDELNELIAKTCEENGIEIKFGFTLLNSKNFIISITDKEVIFNADLANALELSKNPLFAHGDDFEDNIRQTAIDNLVSSLKAVQTTPQLVKSGIELISTLAGVKTKKRAESLIRITYHNQAQYFNKVKAGIGYVKKVATINGEEVEIFSLLEKKDNGEIEVILEPFDIKTLFNVEYDVLADVKSVLA